MLIWHGSDEPIQYPCPSCGFIVFPEPPGSFFICPICDWEDDDVQLWMPTSPVGANKASLIAYQQEWTLRIPLDVQEYQGYLRDPNWRPLKPEEVVEPKFGAKLPEGTKLYYWRQTG